MGSIRDTIERLCKIQDVPANEELIQRAEAVAKVQGLSESDPYLQLRVVDEWYRAQFDEMLLQSKTLIKDEWSEVREEMERRHEVERRKMLQWVCSAFCVIILAIAIGGGFAAYKHGYKAGVAVGTLDARDEALELKKRDEFTNTKEFEGAYRLYQLGELGALITCGKEGWEKTLDEDGYVLCTPRPYKIVNNQRITKGWYIPRKRNAYQAR